MQFDNVNKLLTLMANIGVVAGLIFLAMEVQQNTSALQAGAIQESTNVARQQILALATDKDLVVLNMTPLEQLDPHDQQRAFWFKRSFWLGMQGLFRQWELGALPDEEWSVWQKVICSNYADPGQLWSSQRDLLITEFVQFVESCSGEIEPGVITPK